MSLRQVNSSSHNRASGMRQLPVTPRSHGVVMGLSWLRYYCPQFKGLRPKESQKRCRATALYRVLRLDGALVRRGATFFRNGQR